MPKDKKYVILRNFNSEESLGLNRQGDSSLFAQNDVLLMEGDYAEG